MYHESLEAEVNLEGNLLGRKGQTGQKLDQLKPGAFFTQHSGIENMDSLCKKQCRRPEHDTSLQRQVYQSQSSPFAASTSIHSGKLSWITLKSDPVTAKCQDGGNYKNIKVS